MDARRNAALGLGASVVLHGAALAAAFAFGSGWWGAALPVVGPASPAAWPVVWTESETQSQAVSEPPPPPAPANVQPSPRAQPPKPMAKPEPAAVESVVRALAVEAAETFASNAEQKLEATPLDALEASPGDGAGSGELALTAAPAAAASATIGWSVEVRIPPVYPLAARRRGAEGEVLLRAEIGADGVPTAVAVIRGSGHAELDAAARFAVAKWRFKSSPSSGVEIPIVFRLDAR